MSRRVLKTALSPAFSAAIENARLMLSDAIAAPNVRLLALHGHYRVYVKATIHPGEMRGRPRLNGSVDITGVHSTPEVAVREAIGWLTHLNLHDASSEAIMEAARALP